MVELKSYSQYAVAPYAVAFVSQCQGRMEKVRRHMSAFRRSNVVCYDSLVGFRW